MLDMSTTEYNGVSQHVGFIANPDKYVHFSSVNVNGVCKLAES